MVRGATDIMSAICIQAREEVGGAARKSLEGRPREQAV